MDEVVQIEWIAAGSVFAGTIISAAIASLSAVIVTRMQSRAAMAREERLYARQDDVAAKLLASNARVKVAADAAAKHASGVADKLDAVAANVEKIELASNSMKDALIESTKSEYYAAGVKDQKERGGT